MGHTHHPRILVSGSIHLDLLSIITGHPEAGDSLGDMTIEVGGAAYNIAVGLMALGGCSVQFHTALRDSSLSRFLIGELVRNHIDPLIEFNDSLPQSGFSAHLSEGVIASAVSSIAIERHEVRDRAKLRRAMAGAAFFVADGNHSVESLTTLLDLARELGIPSAVCAVSEPKSLRLARIPAPDYLFLNTEELAFLQAGCPDWQIPAATTVVLTQGPAGAVTLGCQPGFQSPAAPVRGTITNVLGAGDAFCAGAVHFLATVGGDMGLALRRGAESAALVIQRSNCHSGEVNPLGRFIDELQERAELDRLTGLLTRAAGLQDINDLFEAVPAQAGLSLVFIDIDHFKKVNDTCGHAAGDVALAFVATTLREVLRRDMDVAIRWGGEEFVLALPDCDAAAAALIVARIQERLAATILPEVGWPLTLSAGVADRRSGATVVELINAADQAMYRAKQAGRNRIVLAESA